MSNSKISAISGIAFVASTIVLMWGDSLVGVTMSLTSLALISLMTLEFN